MSNDADDKTVAAGSEPSWFQEGMALDVAPVRLVDPGSARVRWHGRGDRGGYLISRYNVGALVTAASLEQVKHTVSFWSKDDQKRARRLPLIVFSRRGGQPWCAPNAVVPHCFAGVTALQVPFWTPPPGLGLPADLLTPRPLSQVAAAQPHTEAERLEAEEADARAQAEDVRRALVSHGAAVQAHYVALAQTVTHLASALAGVGVTRIWDPFADASLGMIALGASFVGGFALASGQDSDAPQSLKGIARALGVHVDESGLILH